MHSLEFPTLHIKSNHLLPICQNYDPILEINDQIERHFGVAMTPFSSSCQKWFAENGGMATLKHRSILPFIFTAGVLPNVCLILTHQ